MSKAARTKLEKLQEERDEIHRALYEVVRAFTIYINIPCEGNWEAVGKAVMKGAEYTGCTTPEMCSCGEHHGPTE